MALIEILQDCMAGGQARSIGDVFEVPDTEAKMLQNYKLCKPATSVPVEAEPLDESLEQDDLEQEPADAEETDLEDFEAEEQQEADTSQKPKGKTK